MNVEGSTPPLKPPNGHEVTTGELYAALYTLDQRLADRDTVLMGQLGQLRTDFSNHTQDGHPFTDRAAVVKEEIKLDAKKAGVFAALITVAGAVVSFVTAIVTGKVGS